MYLIELVTTKTLWCMGEPHRKMKTNQNAQEAKFMEAKGYLYGFIKDSKLDLFELSNRAYSIMSMSKFPQLELENYLSQEEIRFLKLKLKSNQIDQVINEIELEILNAERSNDRYFEINRRNYLSNIVHPFIQDCFIDYDPTFVKNNTELIAMEIMKMYHDLDEFDSEHEKRNYKYYQIDKDDYVEHLENLLRDE